MGDWPTADGFTPPFADVLSSEGRVRVVAAVAESDTALTASEIASRAGIDRSTFYLHRDYLIDANVLEAVETGPHPRYRLKDDAVRDAIRVINEQWAVGMREGVREGKSAVSDFFE